MSFPQQYARTHRFTLGVPRDVTVSPDGARIVFRRTRSGTDRTAGLWSYDVVSGTERQIADPAILSTDGTTQLSSQEKARRERMRESTAGVTAYATDCDVRVGAFAVDGRLFVVDLRDERDQPRELAVAGPVIDPRPSPDGRHVAYVAGGALRVVDIDGSGDRAVAAPDDDEVTFGLPEHVAAESMGRFRGYWWAPDGDRLVVARVDNRPVRTWYIADPAQPEVAPTAVRYPFAGTSNADVSLWIVDVVASTGRRDVPGPLAGAVEVSWDRQAFEYVTAVAWDAAGLLVAVQNRPQTVLRLLSVDPEDGTTRVLREERHEAWVPIVPGVPAQLADGSLVWTTDLGAGGTATRHLVVGDEPVTPTGLQVRGVLGTDGDTVLFQASDEPTQTHLWTWSPEAGPVRLTDRAGVHTGTCAGGTTVVTGATADRPGTTVTVHRDGRVVGEIESRAERPPLTPSFELFCSGPDELRTALVLPTNHRPGDGPLPVLMDPYGGPAGQMVVASQRAYLAAQWFADQGFAVVVADGRGTPGRGPDWEHSIYQKKGAITLEDQVIALHAAAERCPDLDLTRVAIRGWSYGGYLAALAVLRRPDVFHAAIAGAPVTDQRLYDTHWQERYLGHPAEHPDVYDQDSLLADAPGLRRPLMLIHGLADDNVGVAHTLRLSAALLAAGRPHTVLPLSGVTHMVSGQHQVAANLLLLQAAFLHDALRVDEGGRVNESAVATVPRR
jgi:dipeptidyl-peptidase 4